MTSNHHAPYDLGYTCQWTEQGQRNREVKPIHKSVLSSDRSLQLDCVKLESLSNRGSACRGEYVPGPCTPPVTPREFVTPEVGEVTL